MSILSRYRRTEDAIAAGIGDERAAARLAAQGITLTKLTPVTLSAAGGGSGRGAANPVTALAGGRLLGSAGIDVGRHEDQFKHFSGHPYAIVRTIANRIAGQPLHHARHVRPADAKRFRSLRKSAEHRLPLHLKSQAPDLREYSGGAILEAFRNPNPLMVQHTLVFNTIACLEVTGKAFWWMRYETADDDGDGVGGEPQLWYMPPQWMEPVHTEDKLFAAWKVRPQGGGEPWILPGNEVVYFYYSDISNPLEAYSPFDALAQPIMAHESINESKRRSFLNSVSPAVAITIGQPPEASGVGAALPVPVLTRPQRKALRSILLEEYRGTLAHGLPLILDGFVKDIKRVYDSPRELDFLNSGQATTQDLNMGFGMNGISMGQVEGANRASSATADDHLCDNVVNPRLSLLSQTATRAMPRYFVKGGGRDDVVYWEPAKSRDVEFELKLEESMVDRGALNRDEWRGRHGMSPIVNGTAVLVDGNAGAWVDVVPVEPDAAKDGAEEDGRPGNPNATNPDATPRPLNLLKLPRNSMAARLGIKAVGEAHDRVHRLYEDRIKADAVELLRGLAAEYRQRVGAQVAQAGAQFTRLHAEVALDRHHWEYVLRTGLTPVLNEAAIAGAAHEWILAQHYSIATKSFLPDGIKRRVGAAIDKLMNNGMFRRIVDAIVNRVRRAVDKAGKIGESLPAAAVEAVATEEAVVERAAEIGQMEGQSAVSSGQHEVFSTLKIMHRAGGRQWLSMRDNKVRPTHDMAHGQVVRGDQKFTVGGYQCDYPGDHGLPPEERINCRCVAVVVE